MDALTRETSVTRPALEQAKAYLNRSLEVARLRKIGNLLGVFANAVDSTCSNWTAVEEY